MISIRGCYEWVEKKRDPSRSTSVRKRHNKKRMKINVNTCGVDVLNKTVESIKQANMNVKYAQSISCLVLLTCINFLTWRWKHATLVIISLTRLLWKNIVNVWNIYTLNPLYSTLSCFGIFCFIDLNFL